MSYLSSSEHCLDFQSWDVSFSRNLDVSSLRDPGVSFLRERQERIGKGNRSGRGSWSGKGVKPYAVPGNLLATGSQLVMEPPDRYGRRYMDIRYDFNIKHVFGREEGRDLRTDLLNSLLEGRKIFNDVRLGPTERQGAQERNRKARFDLQCIGDGGEQILLEMQRSPAHQNRLPVSQKTGADAGGTAKI